ncbi:Alkyl hydroperoxide reductase AhpD [Planctomycetes bacterium Pan216]|uniref:Alkyl hydroperoxide reductase AhpD n=1 Tax=Kolteria novifilia TaxID=2527975 RepID=A0A518BAQ1_9BACT|nr:Alkyl hydroperoxide reductase AhpD [Planctomycetes bacterium Pan216]
MSPVAPVSESEAVDKTAQTYGRIKEMLGSDTIPEPFLYYGRVPAFLQDFYMNVKKFVYTDGKLDAKLKALIALCVARSMHCKMWIDPLTERCKSLGYSDQELADALAIVSTCYMYNIFFKFRDIAGSDVFGGMSVGLRAHAFGNTSLDDKTVELINVVISDINACKPCTSGHVTKARDLKIPDEAIQEAIQCAATIAAGCTFLNSVDE